MPQLCTAVAAVTEAMESDPGARRVSMRVCCGRCPSLRPVQFCRSFFGAVLLSGGGFWAMSRFGLGHSVHHVKISRQNPKPQWAVGKSGLTGRHAGRDLRRRQQSRRKADQEWPEMCGSARGGIRLNRQGMRAKLDSNRVAPRNEESSSSSSCSSSSSPSCSVSNGEHSSHRPVA